MPHLKKKFQETSPVFNSNIHQLANEKNYCEIYDMNMTQYAPFLFTASIAAAGLMYAAGSVITKKKAQAEYGLHLQQRELRFDTGFDEKNAEVFKKAKENLEKFARKLAILIMLDVLLFIISNLMIIIYWIFDTNIILDVAVILYFFGLAIMMLIVILTLCEWEIQNKVDIVRASHDKRSADLISIKP